MPEANVNTTEIEIPVTMQLGMTPTPAQIKPEGEDGEVPPVFKDDVRDAIFAKRREILTKEMADQGLEPSTQAEPPMAEQKTPLEAEIITPPVVEQPLAAAKTPEEEAFILNVYGKEQRYNLKDPADLERLKQSAQKGEAATQIFQEGHRMRDEALQIANAVKQNLQPQPAAKENPPQATQPVIDKDKAREVAKRINYGSEEDQVNAIVELSAEIASKVRGQVTALPPEQIAQFATQQAIATIRAEQEQETLKREFADILADKPISSAADVIANELAENYRQQGIVKSRLDLFREAGTIARDKYLKPKVEAAPVQNQPPATPTIVVSNDRLERKRAAPKPPAAANKVAAEPPTQYGVGVSSIVNQMRKARGQPVLT